MLSTLWQAEPVMVSLAGSVAVWAAVFSLLDSYGVHLTVTQQSAWSGLFMVIAGIVARSQVSPTK